MDEIFNHERIEIDEKIERFGIERLMTEIRSICEEKAGDMRRTYEEREALKNVGNPQGINVRDVDQLVGKAFDYHGGKAVLEALIRKVEAIGEDFSDRDMKAQCKKQVDALRLKTVRDAWGIS